MKKVKIMLLSLALIAVVGGALAFKAKFDTNYCTITSHPLWTCTDGGVQPLATKCVIDPSINYTTTNDSQFAFYCYTTSNGVDACDKQRCPVTSSLKPDTE
jgi:hypothetical protein